MAIFVVAVLCPGELDGIVAGVAVDSAGVTVRFFGVAVKELFTFP